MMMMIMMMMMVMMMLLLLLLLLLMMMMITVMDELKSPYQEQFKNFMKEKMSKRASEKSFVAIFFLNIALRRKMRTPTGYPHYIHVSNDICVIWKCKGETSITIVLITDVNIIDQIGVDFE